MLSSGSTIPGISFDAVQPELRDVLPRMDIAAFVGFASAGPLHTPVAVESVHEFRDIFGADLSLAWNAELNRAETSYLGQSVEAFFRNGGRRCWVVRVADETLAQTAEFRIPGLIRTNGERVEPGYANARSPGNWAQRVSVSSRLQVEVLPFADQTTSSVEPRFSLTANDWYIDVTAAQTQVAIGDLISVNLRRDEVIFLLIVASVDAHQHGLRLAGTAGYMYAPAAQGSPEAFDPDLALTMSGGLSDFLLFKLEDIPSLGIPIEWPHTELTAQPPLVQKLNYELIAGDQGVAGNRTLLDLGFVAEHSRFWGMLPSDEDLFIRKEGRADKLYSDEARNFLAQISEPRFPLSAPQDASSWHYLPHAMDLFIDADNQTRAEFSQDMGRLQREGIEQFNAELFLDHRLQGRQADILLQEANSLAYLSNSASPQKLRGIHSLLLLDEVTLAAVPDASHRNWDSTPPPFSAPLVAPSLESISEGDTPGTYTILWNHDAGETETLKHSIAYTLEWSTDSDFSIVDRVLLTGTPITGSGHASNLLELPPTSYDLVFAEKCSTQYYFRVRTEQAGEVSPWSNNKARTIPRSNFLDCRYVQAGQLEVLLSVDHLSSPEADTRLLRWQSSATTNQVADYFEVQRSSDRLFSQVESLLGADDQADNPNFSIEGSPALGYSLSIDVEPNSTYYYRVRSVSRDTLGPWSNTLTLWPTSLSQTSLELKTDYSHLDVLAIHRALLRCSAARGDMFAVLTLPNHYRVQEVSDHYALLKPGSTLANGSSISGVQPLSIAEESAASHAALYYPWVMSPSESNGQGKIELQTMPPDGPIIGKIAARTITHGAWAAPANSPLTEVLGLTDQVSDLCWARLSRSQINVLRKSVDGFFALSAHTLSAESEFREINVRRLMSLLRRIALREGNRFVFEPNNAAFQERMQQHFESVLAKLFARGAFSGATASQAYRVVADSSVNTPQSVGSGRLIVELWVAPSNALKFIRVRLTQSGPSQLQVQEV